LRFVRGTDRIAGLRLTPTDLYRWTCAQIYSITVLSHDEREALRPRCGPRPA
jgi:hypothetical protein